MVRSGTGGVGSRHTMAAHVWLSLRRLEAGERSKNVRGDGSSWSSEIRIALSLPLCLLPLVLARSLAPPLRLKLPLHPPHLDIHTNHSPSCTAAVLYASHRSQLILLIMHPGLVAFLPFLFHKAGLTALLLVLLLFLTCPQFLSLYNQL